MNRDPEFRENIERLVMDHINVLNAFEGTAREYKVMENAEQKIMLHKIENERLSQLTCLQGTEAHGQLLQPIIDAVFLLHDIMLV